MPLWQTKIFFLRTKTGVFAGRDAVLACQDTSFGRQGYFYCAHRYLIFEYIYIFISHNDNFLRTTIYFYVLRYGFCCRDCYFCCKVFNFCAHSYSILRTEIFNFCVHRIFFLRTQDFILAYQDRGFYTKRYRFRVQSFFYCVPRQVFLQEGLTFLQTEFQFFRYIDSINSQQVKQFCRAYKLN